MHFITALAILPLALAIPTKRNAPDCASEKPVWTLSDVYYHDSYIFSTPSHQIPGGFYSFSLTNSQISTTSACSARSTRLQNFFYGEIDYTCEEAEGSNAQATFTYNYPTNEVTVDQTWTCVQNGQELTFTGRGKAAAPEKQCTTDTYQNEDWQMGEIYSSRVTDCERTQFSFEPSELVSGA